MPTSIYWIHETTSGSKIGTMPRPRGSDWLEGEILHFKKQRVHTIVSLLQPEEIVELDLGQQKILCEKYGIEFLHFPITDRALPDTGIKTDEFINNLFDKLLAGKNIVIHCRMGIGRSSIIAGAVLLHTGQKTEDIISKISKIRGLKVPDTNEQLNWLKSRENRRR